MVSQDQRGVTVEGLSIARAGGVSAVRLSRQERRNAMTRSLLEELPDALAEEVDGGARAVVLGGSDEVFSSGVDLDEVAGDASDVALDELIGGVAAAIRRLPVPVVAAIDGPCSGAAVELALACDVRIGGERSFFLLPAVRLGLLYRTEGVIAMCAEVGSQTMTRLLVFGERIPASEAYAAGLLARVVPAGEAFATAMALAEAAAAQPAGVVAATIELIRRAADDDVHRDHWDALQRRLLESEARREALARAKANLGLGTVEGRDG